MEESNVQAVKSPVVVCGDIHGQFVSHGAIPLPLPCPFFWRIETRTTNKISTRSEDHELTLPLLSCPLRRFATSHTMIVHDIQSSLVEMK